MNHAKPLLSLMIAGLLTVGCSGYGTKTATAEDVQNALKQAVATLDKAQKSGFEWRDSRKILKAAEDAAKAGELDKAVELAHQARRQGEQALIQAQTPAMMPHS